MLSAKAIVNFTLLAVIVPRIISRSISSRTVHGSEVRLNFLGAEASILISVVGVFCVALAFKFWMLLAALMIYALGSALPVFTMSLVKSQLIALGDSDTQDFSIVMLTKTLGSLVGAPLMASLWIQAIKLGGVGLGLPYFVSAVSPKYRCLTWCDLLNQIDNLRHCRLGRNSSTHSTQHYFMSASLLLACTSTRLPISLGKFSLTTTSMPDELTVRSVL